jgi:hypothetical protein
VGSSMWVKRLQEARKALAAAREQREFLLECGKSTKAKDKEIAELKRLVESYRFEVEERT